MKKKLIFAILCLLLTGCQQEKPDTDISANMSEPTGSQSEDIQGEKGSSDEVGESEPIPTPIKPEDNPSWEAYSFTTGPFSMELPQGWAENKEMGGSTTIFFTDSARDIKTQPSNVVIEILPSAVNRKQPDIDYTDPEVQQEFIAFLKGEAEGRIGTLTNCEVEIWEQPMVFILGYDRDTEDGTTVRQTCYYPVAPEYHSMVVYATDFHDDITPPLEEVVLHMLTTWHSDWADEG